MIMTLGIPKQFTLAIMAVFLASFAGTTLDTATRIQRYVISELFTNLKLERVFALLSLGVFVGIPSPPIHITTELLPDIERKLGLLCEPVATAHDPLGTLFSVFGIA